MLTLHLKKVWFDKIKSGKKIREYREVKDFWTDRLVKEFFNIDKKKKPHDFEIYKQGMIIYLQNEYAHYNRPLLCFMNGMKSEEDKPRLYAKMKSIRIINGSFTDLKIDTPVYEIEFELMGYPPPNDVQK